MRVIGLMSGTSADGIDVALCEITGAPPQLHARVIDAQTIAYPAALRQQILLCCQPQTSSVDALCGLNAALGEAFAAAVQQIMDRSDTGAGDLIGSHGQTVWHQVEASGRVSATLQIASAAIIAERSGLTTISDFRTRDVAAGGQGAPLTAYVDWLLLRHETKWRAVQNIGGMGNVTFLPPLSEAEAPLLAFDTGPGNVLMDGAIEKLSQGALTYDADGGWARAGIVHGAWLEGLMDHPYYRRVPPKTTGRELFSQAMAHQLVDEAQAMGLRDVDILATLTALTAHSIAASYSDFGPVWRNQRIRADEIIVGGGGARNPALLAMMADLLAPANVLTHEALGLDSDYKEALVFAVLAYETWHNRAGCLPSQTGARHASVLGQITPGDNYAALIRETWVGQP